MQFINILMLWGLAAIAIPVIIQIFTRKNAQRIRWGAWMFIDATMKKRKKKVLLEDILLLACRCLVAGLLALAFARPFVRPDSPVPWAVVMPLLLLAITMFGVSFALWRYPKHRRIMMAGGIALFALAIACIVFERHLNLKRFGLGASKDVVIVIDGSASMSMLHEGKSNFERGVEEARKYIEQSPRGTCFSVIIGGPVPQVQNPVPLADRRVLMNTLDQIAPVNGTMQIGGTLTAAAVTLAAGHNAVKQIIIVGDGQTVGWQLESVDRWKTIQRVFTQLGTSPIVVWRTLPLPTSIRNLAISEVRPSRDVVGTDREVKINVTVVNAGTEAVTPKAITLRIGEEIKKHPDVRQLEPGESQTVTFKHQFKNAGGTELHAHVEAEDDLPADDTYRYVLPVLKSLKVLIVDGESSPDVFRRGSTYVSLALRPELARIAGAPASAAAAANPDGATGSAAASYMLDTKIEDITVAGQRTGFNGFSAVVLIGIRTIPAQLLEGIAKYVEKGGGVFFMPGPATDASLFNGWKASDGTQALPADLAKWHANLVKTTNEEGKEIEAPCAIDTSSFQGDALKIFRSGTDLGTIAPPQYWTFGEHWASNTTVLAKFQNGDPFIFSRQIGRGTLLMSAMPFDPTSGIVSKRGFLPFMHELAYSLARPAAVTLDVRPSDGITILLASGAGTGGTGDGENGLVGYYYPQPKCQGKPILRTDKQINFWWGRGKPINDPNFPADNFSVKWRGAVIPPELAEYEFYFEVDDRVTFTIGGKTYTRNGNYRFKNKNPVPITITYEEDSGDASCRMRWRKQGENWSKLRFVPSENLLSRVAGGEGAGSIVEAKDPQGQTFYGEIYSADLGLFFRSNRTIIPGVYSISGIPDFLKDPLAGVMTPAGTIMFSVSAGVEESTMEAISPEQISQLCNYLMISTATKEEDVIKSIGGQSFGKEVWRVLAFAAFIFLILEVFLARWIAISRRTGEQINVDFKNDRLQATDAFRRSMDQLNDK